MVMRKYVDVLTPAISDCPFFSVDITEKQVSVHPNSGPYGVWGISGLQTMFQNRDNIKILSIGLFMPENFTFTIADFPLYNNTAGNPAPVGTLRYTALVDRTDGNGVWLSGHSYEAQAGMWYDMNNESISPHIQLNLSTSPTTIQPSSPNKAWMPGYGCSTNGVFVLPFPNYELVLDLYCDIANFSRTLIPDDEFFVHGSCYCPDVSMIGVPSDLDGRLMRIVPFVKIAHTCPLIEYSAPAPSPEPPIAEFSWRDEEWLEHADPHGDEFHNDPIAYPWVVP